MTTKQNTKAQNNNNDDNNNNNKKPKDHLFLLRFLSSSVSGRVPQRGSETKKLARRQDAY